MDRNGHICLCDFGLAVMMNNTNMKTLKKWGTPNYMPKELMMTNAEGKTNESTDTFALGVTFYEIIIGRFLLLFSKIINLFYYKKTFRLSLPPSTQKKCIKTSFQPFPE